MKTTALCLLSLATLLPAQKMPLPDGSGRQLQLFDLSALFPKTDLEEDQPKLMLPRAAEPAGKDHDLGTFLRQFVEPPLTATDAITVLGGQWLAVLASPAQVAAVERMLTVGRKRREDLLDIEVRLMKLTSKDFDELLLPKLVVNQRGEAKTFENVLPKKLAAELLDLVTKREIETLSSPRLMAQPLQLAEVSFITQTSYVQDYTVTRRGDEVIADPIVAVVWDGVRAKLRATFLPSGLIGLTCDVECQELERPIASFETKLAGTLAPVTIQMPRITGVHLRQTAQLGDGDAVVLGSQRVDGAYLVAVVTAQMMPTPK